MQSSPASNGFVSFSSKLDTFIADLDLKDAVLEKNLSREIVKYFLKVGSRRKQTFVLKSMFAKLGLRSEIDRFQNDYIHISFYLMQVLYPAILANLKGVSPVLDNEVLQDVYFCLGHLTAIEIEAIRQATLDFDSTSHPVFASCVGDGGWVKNYKSLQKYVRSKLRKFYIILKNDSFMDIEDCAQEILVSIVRVYNADPKAFANKSYVDMAINNQINTFLSYHTRGKRKRIIGAADSTYREINSLKKKMLYSDDKETYATAIADLQKGIETTTEYQSKLLDFADTAACGCEIFTAEDSIEDKVFISEMLAKVGSKKVVKEYFQIILDHNPEFELWATEQKLNPNNFSALCRYARKYLQEKYAEAPMSNWSAYINSNLDVRACLTA